MRSTFDFNQGWRYLAQAASPETRDANFEAVTLPHSNVLLPHRNFDDAEYQFISTYRKTFTLPEPRQGRRVYLDFDGALTAATVRLNGHSFGEHPGGFTPFSHDITDALHDLSENQLEVLLDSRERSDIPPFGYSVDYMVFGGIYRDVRLRYVEPLHVQRAHVRTSDVLSDAARVEVDVILRNQGSAQDFSLHIKLLDAQGEGLKSASFSGRSQPGDHKFTLALDGLSAIQRWSLDHPALYEAEITLLQGDAVLDEQIVRFGFREAVFRDDGFYLNGQRIQLRGLNRHQTYPYIGAAAPARLQRKDAEIVKYELGCNVVRTSHYPQSPYFLDRCDEIGLLVFEEIPGWQHIGDEDWQALTLRDVRAMIERDANHPSIIIWGVRINESWDNHDFYIKTNMLARQMDPTRPTGGVRFFLGSEFLEDVYTLNDFSRGVVEPEHTPHLITEFNGHMFPTKSYDHDARRVEHALKHARIQNLAAGNAKVSGAIGWCAFDYNTHREFGAGDRICHHGVMDIFRLPKYAAYFYASQQDPSQRVVLHIANNWRLGDYDEGLMESVVVFSNCDEVEAFVGDYSRGRFVPARAEFPHLAHPPFFLRDLDVMLAHPYGDLRVVGYRGGQAVAEQRIAMDSLPRALHLRVDDAELHADGADMTRLVFAITDQYDNPLPYASAAVTFEIEGPAQLIGENPFALVGGQAALYVRAGHQAGTVTIRAKTPRLPAAQAQILIR